MKESEPIKKPIKRFVHKTQGNISCCLCPNNCIIAEGNYGLCHARVNIEGRLYSTVYGYPCSINLDPIEKKPLYHYFPGQKILSIGTYGCNLFCKGCQNFDISRNYSDPKTDGLKYFSPKDIVDLALKNDIRMIAYTYNEPTIFFEYMIDIARIAKRHGIKNVIVSNGYINPEPLKELCKYIDAANIDLKGMTEKFYKTYCGIRLEPILETIKYLHKKKIWLELTNLLIPGLNDDEKDIKMLCDWIVDNLGKDVPLHFSRFYPYYKASEMHMTSESSLMHAKDVAIKDGIKYVYIGNLGSLENTLCQGCGTVLIRRDDGKLKIDGIDKQNRCVRCSRPLPGIFY